VALLLELGFQGVIGGYDYQTQLEIGNADPEAVSGRRLRG
jgi:hypothetical protein